MSTKNRKQIIESVKTHNKVLVKNLLLEKAEPTALGTVQNIADMGALGSGLLGGVLMFVPGLQPVGAGLLGLSRTAGWIGAGAAGARGLNRALNPNSGEVLPAQALFSDALIGGAGSYFARRGLRAAKNVDAQINKIVDFRNNRTQNLLRAHKAEATARAKSYNLGQPGPNNPMYQVNKDAIEAEIKAAQDTAKQYTKDTTTGFAYGDPGVLASKTRNVDPRNLFDRAKNQRWLTGPDELTDLNRINAFVNARGGAIKSKNQLGNLESIPGGKETVKRINRTVGLPNYVNLFRPQGMIGQVKEDDPNYNQSVFGRAVLGPDTGNPFGRSTLSTRMRVRPAPGILSSQELVGQEQQYPTSSLLNTWYAINYAL